jgi:hypothetical protein
MASVLLRRSEVEAWGYYVVQYFAPSSRVLIAGHSVGLLFSPFFVHDPQSGVITRDQIQSFIKSTRCELITYFEANRRRKEQFFDLSRSLFGNVILDLNVVDTAGFPPGATSIDRLHTNGSPDSFTWHVGPILNGQNTYDMIVSFIVPQNATLNLSDRGDQSVKCYAHNFKFDNNFEGLARGEYREMEQFTRILVNGTTPLAAWLLDISSEMWPSVQAAKLGETAYPVQMAYTFTVQFTAGVEVKYSLTNPVWSPLAIGAAASAQQTSQLKFTLNGPDASLAVGASTGIAVIGGGSNPPYVPPGDFLPRAAPGAAPARPLVEGGQEGAVEPSGAGRRRPRGHLLYPLPLLAPQPVC